MTWGPLFMYYRCGKCGKQFKYELGRMDEFGDKFGKCPSCNIEGTFVKDGARGADDAQYEEVDE